MRIRLAMHGTRNNRIFHLVAIDQRKSRNARPAELLGVYDPALHLGEDRKKVEWSVDRIKYWLGVGARPSKSALKLLEMVGSALVTYIVAESLLGQHSSPKFKLSY